MLRRTLHSCSRAQNKGDSRNLPPFVVFWALKQSAVSWPDLLSLRILADFLLQLCWDPTQYPRPRDS